MNRDNQIVNKNSLAKDSEHPHSKGPGDEGIEEGRSNTKSKWRDWIDIFLKIFSMVLMIFFACLGYCYNSRVANEQRIKELVNGLTPEEPKKQVFSSYTLARFQFPEKKASKDKNVQKLLARQISILILGEIYPDVYNSKDRYMFERLQVIDKAINDKQSSEVIFAEILFQKNDQKAIEALENFIKSYPKHWLIPWAYYNIASILSVIDPLKAREYAMKALNKAREFGYEDGEIEEMSKRLKKRIEGFKGE